MRYTAVPHTKAARKKITRVMREFRSHRLYTPSGRRVTKKRQALAIALSEARHTRHHRHRRNPPGGHGKWLAFGLIGLGVYFLLRPTSSVPVGPVPQQPGGLVGTLGNILAPIGQWTSGLFPASGSSGWWPSSWSGNPTAASTTVPVVTSADAYPGM